MHSHPCNLRRLVRRPAKAQGPGDHVIVRGNPTDVGADVNFRVLDTDGISEEVRQRCHYGIAGGSVFVQ
jgi:hypothetical protein